MAMAPMAVRHAAETWPWPMWLCVMLVKRGRGPQIPLSRIEDSEFESSGFAVFFLDYFSVVQQIVEDATYGFNNFVCPLFKVCFYGSRGIFQNGLPTLRVGWRVEGGMSEAEEIVE